jgi:uncharacterized protein YyaL (SSP411 family)
MWGAGGLVASLAVLPLLLGCGLREGDLSAEPVPKGAKAPANRLASETSPYLLAHAHNPVDWYPWGAEALEAARRQDKPLFISIGYSTCHWCHVMERKVFSDPEIAKLMNEHFINVKIDREERPDLDELYMTALQVYFQAIGSGQSGGWPLSLFLTPDGRPIGGGTYFPPRDDEADGDRIGFPTLLRRVRDAWKDKRPDVESNADTLARGVRTALKPKLALAAVPVDRELVKLATDRLSATFDSRYGGFGFDPADPERPKFPTPCKLSLLLYEAGAKSDGTQGQARKMALATLDAMAAGGLYDHLGGGFHRYSTDREWRVPHFEKMLYDNAQLAGVYAEAYRLTRDERYRRVADETLGFLLRELADVDGGFYCGLDAETDGVEGRFYVWSRGDLAAILPPADAALAERVFALGPQPEFEHGHVLRLERPLVETAEAESLSVVHLERRLASIKKSLLAARNKRTPLLRDDKVLAGWNGLAIGALAKAGMIFEREDYVAAATKCADFVLSRMRNEQGRLLRVYCAREAKIPAYLDDYSFLVEGLLALYPATADEKWLNAARRLTEQQLELFKDTRGGGCFHTATDHETLLARPKVWIDSVVPSGNSVLARNLLRLAQWTKTDAYRASAQETLTAFAPQFADHSGGLANMALAVAESVDDPDFLASALDRSLRRPRSGAGVQLTSGEKTSGAGAKESNLVTGVVYLSTDKLPSNGTCFFALRLKIAEGWHINANPTGSEFLEPTELTAFGKFGTEMVAIRYPSGKDLVQPGSDEQAKMYEGEATIYGELRAPAKSAGRMEELVFEVLYGACNDKRCLPPKTLKISHKVSIARAGEEVRGVNAKLFPKPKRGAGK